MGSTKHGRAGGSDDGDASELAPATTAQRGERAPELRLVCTTWRSFVRLHEEMTELDALSLPLSSDGDGTIALAIETPDGDVVRLPACLTGGVVSKHGMPEALIVRLDLDDALRTRLSSYAAQGSALVYDDGEALARIRRESAGAYHVSTVSKRRVRSGDAERGEAPEQGANDAPTTRPSARDSQRPTQRAPSEDSKKPSGHE